MKALRTKSLAVCQVGIEAERLESSDSLTLQKAAGWVKEAVTAPLDALDVEKVEQQPMVATWCRAARRAVGGIDAGGLLRLQTAVVQDAFRSTVDAFLVASQYERRCPRGSPTRITRRLAPPDA